MSTKRFLEYLTLRKIGEPGWRERFLRRKREMFRSCEQEGVGGGFLDEKHKRRK